MKFTQMSATMGHEESEPVITALNEQGEIWQGWKSRKHRQFEITYDANLTGEGEPNPRVTTTYVWDEYMIWEYIVPPFTKHEGPTTIEILVKKAEDPKGYLSHRTISIKAL